MGRARRFSTFEDLVGLLKTADLPEISRRMQEYNNHVEAYVEDTWIEVSQA